MKAQAEIQAAHDVLWEVVMGEPGKVLQLSLSTIEELKRLLNVLCWVLEHEHNQQFGCMLHRLQARIESLGFRLQQYPDGAALPRDH